MSSVKCLRVSLRSIGPGAFEKDFWLILIDIEVELGNQAQHGHHFFDVSGPSSTLPQEPKDSASQRRHKLLSMFDLRGRTLKPSQNRWGQFRAILACYSGEASVAVYNHCKDAKPGKAQKERVSMTHRTHSRIMLNLPILQWAQTLWGHCVGWDPWIVWIAFSSQSMWDSWEPLGECFARAWALSSSLCLALNFTAKWESNLCRNMLRQLSC